MSPQAFKDQIERLEEYFRPKNPPSENETVLAEYYKSLQHHSDSSIERAVANIISDEEYFPKINTLKKYLGGTHNRGIIPGPGSLVQKMAEQDRCCAYWQEGKDWYACGAKLPEDSRDAYLCEKHQKMRLSCT